jgi:hypothetical protein
VRAITLASLFIAAALGCSATSGTDFTASAGAGGDGSGSGQGASGSSLSGNSTAGVGSGFTTGSGASSGSGAPGCTQAAELVYVFSLANDIYSFDPPNKTFTFIAKPDCPTGGMQPNSMAIDRSLVAWLNYIGGIYTFDLTKKTGCKLAITPPAGFAQIGMGFSTEAVGGTAETLYVASISGNGLGRVDMSTMNIIPIGSYSNDPLLTGQSAELTGTGDARLFGYFTTFPYTRVAELDKTNANVLSNNELTGVAPPQNWAFSFWGGEFYLYADPGSNTTGNSSVIRYNPTNGSVDTAYVADVGFEIIGAGVSTCAPTVPPN